MRRPHSAVRCSLCAATTALGAAFLLAACGVRSAAAQPATAAARDSSPLLTQMVDMGGYKLRVTTGGAPVAGRPTVVFENGLGTPLDSWGAVQRDLAREGATFAYDRAGIGRSEPGREAPTFEHVVGELHALLAKAGARAPYVLVGHSYGGPLIRLFAARYPGEVAGLVYVDPTDFLQTLAAQDSVWQEAGVPDGRVRSQAGMQKALASMPGGIRAEAAVAFQADGFAAFRALPPAPNVPAVVLLSGRRPPPPPPEQGFPGDTARWNAYAAATIRQRVAHMTALVRAGEPGAQGTVVLTTKSGHFIQSSEPELVAWAVRRALTVGQPKRPSSP